MEKILVGPVLASKILGCDHSTIHRQVARGWLKPARRSRPLKFDAMELLEIARQRPQRPSHPTALHELMLQLGLHKTNQAIKETA